MKTLNIKIDDKFIKKAFLILKENYNNGMVSIHEEYNITDSDFEVWKEHIQGDEELNMIAFFYDEIMVGFMIYKRKSDYIWIDELHLDFKFQGDKVSLNKALDEFLKLEKNGDELIIKFKTAKRNIKCQKAFEKMGAEIEKELEHSLCYSLRK